MVLAEERLNNSILRKELLKELKFLLEVFDPTDKQLQAYKDLGDRTIAPLLSSVGKMFYEAWRELKSGVNDPKLFVKASGLAYEDIKILAQKDPTSFICWVLDVVSLFDPTGTADIAQGGILIAQGIAENNGLSIFIGIICIISGFMTASAFLAAVGTGGAATPILALAKASGVALKQLTTQSIRKIAEILSHNGSYIMSILRKMRGFDKKAIIQVEKVIVNSKKLPPPTQGEKAAELIEKITGVKPAENAVSPLNAAGKTELIKDIEKVKAGGIQALGFALSTSTTAVQGSDIANRQRAEEVIRNNYCKRNFQKMSICDDIITYGKEYKHFSKTDNFDNLFDFNQIFEKILNGQEIYQDNPKNSWIKNPENWEDEKRGMSRAPWFIQDPDVAAGIDPNKPPEGGEIYPDKSANIKNKSKTNKKFLNKNKRPGSKVK